MQFAADVITKGPGVTLPCIFTVVTAATGLIGAFCPCLLKKGWSCYAFLFFCILSGQGQNVRAVKWSMAENTAQLNSQEPFCDAVKCKK